MKLKTLLLGTTSLCLLAFLPMAPVNAQDAALVSAYNAYVSASSGEDADAKAAAQAAFEAECQRAGVSSLDACIALATGQAPAEAPAAEPAQPEEPAPEQPAPEQPAPEQPAPEQPASEQPAPEQPAPEQPAAEQPAPEQPAPEQPAPEQPAAEQPAPEQPAAEQPAPEQPAPEQPAASPASDPALVAAYEAYVSASSGTDANAKASAEAAFLAECNRLGISTLEECLAVMGGGATPAPAPEQPADQPSSSDQPANGEVTPSATETGQPAEEIPGGVETPDAPVAPVLDSAKEGGRPQGDQPATDQPPAEPAPPATSADTQPTPPVTEADIDQTISQEGTRIEELPLEQPKNVDVVSQTQDNKLVINIGINVVIYTPYKDRDRIGRDARDVYYDELPNGRVRQTVIRNDGTQVITVWNRFGEIEKRIKIGPDGRRYVLVYTNRDDDGWRDPGRDLPPFRLTIPVNEYVIYSADADEDQLVTFFEQPPLEQARRVYSVDEVKRSARIRDTVRRVDIGDITFETDSAQVDRDQVGSLTKVAQAMARIIQDNPSEVFLIEGHTDAVGSDEHNLELSDNRAETIANLLTDVYKIPPENVTTQGYGEQYLKVQTEGPERANRRVTVRRITPLVSSSDNA